MTVPMTHMVCRRDFNWLLGDHDINFGARQHFDETDRFQPVEVYNQVDGRLVFDDVNAVGASDNRLEEAQALSLWITDDYQVTDRLLLNLSLRMEDVETKGTTLWRWGRSFLSHRPSG